MKAVLVIEDNAQEQTKAQQAVGAKGMYCVVAEDLHEALLSLGQHEEVEKIERSITRDRRDTEIVSNAIPRNLDGVITDIHFPIITNPKGLYGTPEPYGLEIALVCQRLQISCVICTDVHHHHSGWIKRLAAEIGVGMVDDKGIASERAWEKAVAILMTKL